MKRYGGRSEEFPPFLCVFCFKSFKIIQNIKDKGRTFVDFSMLYGAPCHFFSFP